MLDKTNYLRSIGMMVALLLLISCNDKKESQRDYGKVTAQTPLEKSIERGAEVYQNFCTQCHRPDGKGVGKTFPPLDGSNWLTEKRTQSIHALKYGLNGEIQVNGVTYNSAMAAQGLSNEEIADVMNYIMNSWSNKQEKMVTTAEVAEVKK